MTTASPSALLQPARAALILTVCIGALGTVATIAQMALLSVIVGRVFLAHRTLAQLWTLLIVLLVAMVVRAALVWLQEVSAQQGAIRVKAALRARLFSHLLRLGPAYTRDEATGELVAVATEGIERLDPYASRYVPQVAFCVIVPLLILGAVCSQDWVSAAILLATAPVIPLLMVLVGSYAQEHIQRQWAALAHMHAYFLDTLQGLPTLQLFGRARDEQARLSRVSRAFGDTTLTVLRYAFLSALVLEFITAGAIALIAVELGTRLLSSGISFERAFFILLLTPEYFRPLRELGTHRHAAMEGRAAAERMARILATPAPPTVEAAAVRLPARSLTIALEAVRYSYPGAERPALTDLTLTLPAGTRTALVGRSGAGKSTLANLLLRFGEPDEGRILVNTLPLADLPPDLWREYLAYVPQRPYLFAGSVRENIALGRPGATGREIERAAALAGAAEFIERQPEGYQTQVGERGSRLSGGEAQRIAIARAFLKDAPLLILDEPTSSLDPTNEALIRVALERLMQGRTVLVIAHRMNTIYTAEQIVVLDG
ncbi:MAG TPA: thiol reductant ABC exporter subunit CydD, partial [Chloroflexota bacterium]|nr:thiol reductant ABC exporter subunit CydD [Chloroflexota bacterium]